MKKELNLDTTIDRRSMFSRLGLMASIAVTAPLLVALSTSVQANHKTDSNDNSAAKAAEMMIKNAGQETDDGDDSGSGDSAPSETCIGGVCI
jgi:hypothetical protein